jgi:hypothetical protein
VLLELGAGSWELGAGRWELGAGRWGLQSAGVSFSSTTGAGPCAVRVREQVRVQTTFSRCQLSDGSSTYTGLTLDRIQLWSRCFGAGTFHQQVSLDGLPGNTGVKLVSTLFNHRLDQNTYSAMTQELPAVYANGPFWRRDVRIRHWVQRASLHIDLAPSSVLPGSLAYRSCAFICATWFTHVSILRLLAARTPSACACSPGSPGIFAGRC